MGIQFRKDQSDRLRTPAALCLHRAAGGRLTPEETKQADAFDGPKDSILEMARYILIKNGERGADCWSPTRIFKSISNAASVSSSDLSNILADSANRFMLQGFDEVAESWRPWVKIQKVNDFREQHIASLSAFADIEEIISGMPPAHGAISDREESGYAKTYGRGLVIPRKVIINDDLSAIAEIPRKMGEAYGAKIEKLCYDALYGTDGTGPTLGETGEALFSSAHSNVGTAGAISVTTLGELRKLLRNQTAAKGMASDSDRRLNLSGRFLIVPSTQETTAQQVLQSVYDPSSSGSTTYNPFGPEGRSPLQLVVSAYADSLSTTRYWLHSDNPLVPSVVLLSLGNEDARPIIRTENTSVLEAQGVKMDVHGSVGTVVANFRGVASNEGA
jgi:hypothetical protein